MPHILVADDEADIRFIYSRWLEAAGHRAALAPDGPSALALIGEVEFDLVILDVMMPGMDGYDVLTRLRAAGSMVPVVMVSAASSPSDIERGLAAGASRYVEKVSNRADLLEIIDQAFVA